MAGTHEDAILIVELGKWATMMGLYEGPGIFAEDFDPETAKASDEVVRNVLIFNETLGTLVKNGLLNRELVLDWLHVPGIWAQVKPAALKAREASGVPQMFENFEALAS
jgi:hypothetical protein